MKICAKCKEKKRKSKFRFKDKIKGTLQPYCIPCNVAYQKEHYEKNKIRYRQAAKERNQAVKDYVRKVKNTTPCTDCRKQYPYYVMEFDHLRDKEHSIADLTSQLHASLKRVKQEMAKCEVVCSNCHKARTWNRMASSSKG